MFGGKQYSGIVEMGLCCMVEDHSNWALTLEGQQEWIFAGTEAGVCNAATAPEKPWASQRLIHSGLAIGELPPGLCRAGESTPRAKHRPHLSPLPP